MPPQRRKRLPISCENCRKRRIRCNGESQPCQTCVKRGMSSTCRFLKDQMTNLPQASEYQNSGSIVSCMEALQDLLEENINLTQRMLSNGPSKPNTMNTPLSMEDSPTATHTPSSTRSGRLILSATGHVRYTGIESTVSDFAADSLCVDLPFSGRGNATHQEILDLLPPFSHCDELKDVFMEVFSPLFHVLHDPTFDQNYKSFRQNPHGADLSFLALVFVVLAIGVTALEDEHPLLADLGRQANPGANARKIAERFRDAAMRALVSDHFLWRHNLQTLQALILLIYALSHAHGPAWSLLGTTLNIAIAIGCHIDPSRYDVTVVEAEERMRCWAALLMLYTIQETSLGIQAPIRIQSDTRLPADIEDEDLITSAIHSTPGGYVSEVPSKMAYILHKFKLYQLAADICSSVTSASRQETLTTHLDGLILTERAKQNNRFGLLNNLPLYHQAHYYILNSYTNHLFLVLHSPSLINSGVTGSDQQGPGLERLSEASLSILDNYETLRTTPTFQKYRWYTDGLGSFHAFLAATTLAALHSEPRGEQLDSQDRSPIIDRLRRCLDHFRAASMRSNICKRATDVLYHLTTSKQSAENQNASRPFVSQTSTPLSRGQGNGSIVTTRTSEAHNTVPSAPRHPSDQPFGDNLPGSTAEPSTLNGNSDLNTADMGIDLDGWTASAGLQDFFGQVPTQQWLSPSVFPWWKWSENEDPYGSYRVAPAIMDV